MQINAVGVDVLHINKRSAPVLTELHNVADILLGSVNVRVGNGLLSHLNKRRIGVVGRVVNQLNRAVGLGNSVNYARRGGDKVEHILAFKAFLNNLHMQKSEKTAAEAEA